METPENAPVEAQPNQPPVPIVAIGASAGGLEAMSDLLTTLSPTTGLAYVYVQHLDPNQKSHLAEILSRLTAMPVVQARDMVHIQPNHVYIIPPDQDMESVDGVLTLMPRPVRSMTHMPIDQFFVSLAERQKDGAIGIVLSGMDSDGMLGLKAIKVAGGITFAQDDTARFQTMPRTAIAEGVVDMVLPPLQIARELERLSQQPDVFRQTALAEEPDDAQTADEDLRVIIMFLQRTVGVDFSHYKLTTIRRRIIRRMLLYKLETLNQYTQYLRQHPTEAGVLYNDLLINVTNFFRDIETMDYLKAVLLPQLIQAKDPDEPIRLWVPACSTGQEAYSIAMMLAEVLGDRASSTTIQIFATDLSESAVAKARLGIYSRSELVDVSPSRLQRFFAKTEEHYRVSRNIRDMCIFAPHNVFKDPPFSRIDLVSCRNLLIYLDGVLQRKAIALFHYALNPKGFLLLGKSETVGASAPLFSQIDKVHKLYARKNDVVSRASFELNPFPGRPVARLLPPLENGHPADPVKRTLRTPNVPKNTPLPTNDLEKEVDSLLLSRYVPTSVVVNQDLDILQFRGATGLFIEPSPGKASLNLLKMARPSLVFELRNTIHKARKLNQPVRKDGLEVRINDVAHQVAIEAVPIKSMPDEPLFLVIFQETVPVILPDSQSTRARNLRIKQLEDELEAAREDMHSILEEREASNEELQSANEEIVSSNEELQSINEEIETSKEEIESTNEELLTINQELQMRNNQLVEAYGYAEAIFATISEATVVLDRYLRVKSANPAFYSIFGLREEQTEGRLIYELGDQVWDIPRLRQLLDEVNKHEEPIRGVEVTHPFPGVGEKTMRFHARRVIQQQQQEAILLAIEDITEHKRAQRLVAERESWFHNVIDKAPTLIWVAGPDGNYTFLNRAWLDYTGQPINTEAENNWVPSIHPDDRAGYLARYADNLKTRLPYEAEYRLLRRDGEYRWMLENARPTFGPDNRFTGYIGTCAEVHNQKTQNQELDRRVRQRTQELVEANVNLERANQTLSQTAENLQAVLNSSPASIGYFKHVADEEDRVIDFKLAAFNGKMARFLNLPVSQLADLSIQQTAPALWLNNSFATFLKVMETGEPYYEEIPETDQEQWVAIALTKYDGGVVLTGLDITALKKAEQQQNVWVEELARSNETIQALEPMREHIRHRGEFLRTTTHDLRGSFGVIQGAASLLDMIEGDEERAQMLTMLQRNLRQVTQMLTQLMDYSRLESGQETIERSTVDVSILLRELSVSLRTTADERKLTVQTNGPAPFLVKSDPVKLLRIAQNLLLNALKYTQTGGVTIAWQNAADGESWQFSVADTGPGLSPALMRMLTDDPANTDQQSPASPTATGEGIGLFIVKRLCWLLNARLGIDGTPTGTTFTITLPCETALTL